ncbi:MAG: baseplate J/gp47 family protein [Acutalibacteraceae bacterium]|nr:baseplate J/gp47 family protein [Acutalibacteraceae bacterium]
MNTYETIVEEMRSDFLEKSGYTPDEASDIGIRIRVLAAQLYNLNNYLEWIKRQAFLQTAEGEYLDYHAQLRGLSRKQAVKAVGLLEFSVEVPITEKIDIPAYTVVSTAGENPISFETTQYASIDVGKSFTMVPARAIAGGVSGNIAPKQISIISTMTVDGLKVANLGSFNSGADEEKDEALRKRVIDSLKFIINGTNKEFYSSLAKTVAGVECVNVIPKENGTGTVTVYISGRDMEVGVAVLNRVQALMDSQREVNVAVSVKSADILSCVLEIAVKLYEGYILENVQQELFANVKAIVDKLEVGQSLKVVDIEDILYHTSGIEEFEVLSGLSTGLTANKNQKIVLDNIYLREDE